MSAKLAVLDSERASELLSYDPETGALTWRVSRGTARAGDEAGWIDPDGYRRIAIAARHYYAHRLAFLIMEDRWPLGTDHRNGVRDDNRWSNLAEITRPAKGALTANRARELLDYDPDSGALTWKVNRHNGARAGDEAGSFAKDGYRQVGIDGRSYKGHRIAFLIMEGRWPAAEIDHADGDRVNNKWANLREVTRRENSQNIARRRDCGLAGRPGVSFDRQNGRWQAYINVDGRRIHLGSFKHLADALAAREKAEREHGFSPRHGKSAGFQPPDYVAVNE